MGWEWGQHFKEDGQGKAIKTQKAERVRVGRWLGQEEEQVQRSWPEEKMIKRKPVSLGGSG